MKIAKLLSTITLLLLSATLANCLTKENSSTNSNFLKKSNKELELKNQNTPNCPYNEDLILEMVKKILNIVLLTPGDQVSQKGANFGVAKSMCFTFFDTKRVAFSKVFTEFHKLVCNSANAHFDISMIENTVWTKMGEMLIKIGNSTVQCTKALQLNYNMNSEILKKVDFILHSYTNQFNNANPNNLPKIITGVLATKRYSPDFYGNTFTNINMASRS